MNANGKKLKTSAVTEVTMYDFKNRWTRRRVNRKVVNQITNIAV